MISRHLGLRRRGRLTLLVAVGLIIVGVARYWVYERTVLGEADWTALNEHSLTFYNQGNLKKAERVALQAIKVAEHAFGPRHAKVMVSLNNVGTLYLVQGRYAEAQPFFERSLALTQAVLDQGDPDRLLPIQGLCQLHYEQGQYTQAEPLCQQALNLSEALYGSASPRVATALVFLSYLDMLHAKYAQAETCLQRALRIRQEVLGADHPDVGTTLHDLAGVSRDQGDVDRAEALYTRALEILSQHLGLTHYRTATVMYDLGDTLYYAAFRLQEATVRHRQWARAMTLASYAFNVRKKVFGLEHPATAQAMRLMACLKTEIGRFYVQVDAMHHQALGIFERTLGPQHYEVAISLGYLAELYQRRGMPQEAQVHWRRALAIYEGALGEDNLYTASTLYQLAKLFEEQGWGYQAIPIYARALRIYTAILGRDDSVVIQIRMRYEAVQQRQRDRDQDIY